VQAFHDKGIQLEPGPAPPTGAVREIRHLSPPLRELLKPFLKNSINFMGDAFLKTLGATSSRAGRSLREEGLSRLKDYLYREGVPPAFTLYDGSGLSRLSRVTPEALLTFLRKIGGENFSALWNALPIAGVDGTLKNRMKGTAAAGVLRAKTGTLDGVYNLAGYVPEGNRFVPFLLLSRTSTALAAAARSAQDRVGARLAQDLGAAPPAAKTVPFPFVPEHAGRDAP
jgi:PBP4 family serine-type D-alanyl-D-alanine carboxypeptidase